MSGDGLIDKPPQMQSHPTTPPRKRGFFDLPLEVRQDIYGYLLLTRRTKRYIVTHPHYVLDAALLNVNRQVHDEAQAVLDQNQFVHIKA